MHEVLDDVFHTIDLHAAPALTEVLETMAFLCAAPLPLGSPEQSRPTGECVRLTLPFAGTVNGVIEILAPDALGAMMASNMLCSDFDVTAQTRGDILLELLNMTCGVIFREVSEQLAAPFNIGLPRLAPFDADAHWIDFVSGPRVALLDVEGLFVAIRVSAGATS